MERGAYETDVLKIYNQDAVKEYKQWIKEDKFKNGQISFRMLDLNKTMSGNENKLHCANRTGSWRDVMELFQEADKGSSAWLQENFKETTQKKKGSRIHNNNKTTIKIKQAANSGLLEENH